MCKNKEFFYFLFQAPQQVKAFAKNLVEGLLTDTMNKTVSDTEENMNKNDIIDIIDDDVDVDEDDLDDDDDDDKIGEETDISLSLATEEQEQEQKQELEAEKSAGSGSGSGNNKNSASGSLIKSPISSHVETDSLDESEHAGQPAAS
jgi:hypothetical protein